MKELRIIEGLYVEKPVEWVSHWRSKNYIAKITGLDRQYGFKREFLHKIKVGRHSYFSLEDFQIGEVYEIKCIYYTNSRNAHIRLYGFFIVRDIKDTVVLEEIKEEEVIRIIKEKYSDTVENVEICRK